LERLEKLGLRQIKDFISMPRSALVRRFGKYFLQRLDQALGYKEEVIIPVQPIEPYQDWLSLLEKIKSYDTVYKWFDYLKKQKRIMVKRYVIMPNHILVIIDFGTSAISINTIVSNAKRFMAYEIIKRLKEQDNTEILLKLAEAVSSTDKEKMNYIRYLSDHLIAKK
jgi:hypothetical protein